MIERLKDHYRRKNQREKFIQESGSPSDLPQSNADLTEQQVTLCSTSSLRKKVDSSSFACLYEKLRNAEDFADRAVQEAIMLLSIWEALIQRRGEIASEKQVNPESNAVSRILNMEVRAHLPAGKSDAPLWKRIEQAKKLWKLFDAIDNTPE